MKTLRKNLRGNTAEENERHLSRTEITEELTQNRELKEQCRDIDECYDVDYESDDSGYC